MKVAVKLAKFPPLSPGDSVRVVAPAGPFDRKLFEAGLAVLSSRYRPVFDDRIFETARYLAGTDERRGAELRAALADPVAKAVFAARGGYGTLRLLPSLKLLGLAPKPVVGFSDLTALHVALGKRGWASIHGPVLTQLGSQAPEVANRLFHLLESTQPAAALTGAATLVPGKATGRLWGGNLSVLTRLLGTRYLAVPSRAILLLEDVGEKPYRLDRMWTHLRLAGVFRKVSGIVLGDFNLCEEPDAPYSAADVLADLARDEGLPCAAGFRIGHAQANFPVPLGCKVRLDADGRRLEFLEAPARAVKRGQGG